MAKHYNPTITQDLLRTFNFKAGDMLGADVGNMIVPVIEIKRHCNICKSNALSNALTSTIYVTPVDKDFYLSSLSFSVAKDATSTSTGIYITCYIDGILSILADIVGFTLTPLQDNVSLVFPIPIKVDRNTIISVNSTTNVANVISRAQIQGYTVETSSGT
jgi:hypothetical protein